MPEFPRRVLRRKYTLQWPREQGEPLWPGSSGLRCYLYIYVQWQGTLPCLPWTFWFAFSHSAATNEVKFPLCFGGLQFQKKRKTWLRWGGHQERKKELVKGIWEGDNVGSVKFLDLHHRFDFELVNRLYIYIYIYTYINIYQLPINKVKLVTPRIQLILILSHGNILPMVCGHGLRE